MPAAALYLKAVCLLTSSQRGGNADAGSVQKPFNTKESTGDRDGNRLTGHPNVFVEQNIWSNGELMGFSPINVMWDGRNAPTLLCRYTFDGGQYYSLQVSEAAELETRGYQIVCDDLQCLKLKTAKARRSGILALILADAGIE